MGLEIERKFLVKGESYQEMAESSVRIVQGYLNRDPDSTVRIRIMKDNGTGESSAFLTVKSRNNGAVRHEWEFSIPSYDAEEIMMQCAGGKIIDKVRWIVPFGGYIWEVDEFLSPRKGLVVAEVELPDALVDVPLPPFAGEEVTGDPAYYNSAL